jgi:hypothetical protein
MGKREKGLGEARGEHLVAAAAMRAVTQRIVNHLRHVFLMRAMMDEMSQLKPCRTRNSQHLLQG